MAQYAICTDLDRCVGCLACSVSCKVINGVPIGSFWNKTLRVGPTPKSEGAQYPDVETYFLNIQCQHCTNPQCVEVCPTEASYRTIYGTVQIDKSRCIGCQFCVMSCPYGVRYLNEEEGVVEKCTMCQQRTAEGELPQCVSQCSGMARWFGDLDEGIESFKGPRGETLGNFLEAFSEENIHHLTDVGNGPNMIYIQRQIAWQGVE